MRRCEIILTVLGILLRVLFTDVTPARAQICVVHELQKFTAKDTAERDYFGRSVAVYDDLAVVGTSFSGSVYVFRIDDNETPTLSDDVWIEEARLNPPNAQSIDFFGSSVSTNGEWIAVGAPGDDDIAEDAGSVHVYRRDDSGTPLIPSDDSWIPEATLTPTDASANNYFGGSVCIYGDYIIAGAFRGDAAANDAGAAYVFRRDTNGTPSDHSDDTWVLEATLTATDAAEDDRFGGSVSISGHRAVVGATYDEDAGRYSGSAYVFLRHENSTPSDPTDDFWIQETKLTASDASDGDTFGTQVGIDDATIVVGSPRDDDMGSGSGAAYVYRLHENETPLDLSDDFWVQDAKLVASDASAGALFGSSVSVSGNRIIVGAAFDNGAEFHAGAAYVFRHDDTWFQEGKYIASDASDRDRLGGAVSLGGDRALVGSASNHAVGQYSGAVYAFPIHKLNEAGEDCNGNGLPDDCEPDCNRNSHPDECDIANGTSDDCQLNGTPDECEIDCNNNSVPDDCDVATDPSTDINSNGIPDECEPPNDLCAKATPIGAGHFAFDTTWAGTDGNPYLYECGIFCEMPCMRNDIWYDFAPSCSGIVEIVPDGQPGGLTVIVYQGCTCPHPDTAVACSEFFGGGTVEFTVLAGQCYKIRLGNASSPGAFTLSITPPCDVAGNGDVDEDGDVDIDDYADWPGCVTGPLRPGVTFPARCRPFDFDLDGAIDLRDAAALLPDLQNVPGRTLHVPAVYPTIQSAIDAAQDHDTVVVASGVYAENINLLGKPIHVLAAQPFARASPALTIIDGMAAGPVVTFAGSEHASTLLAGFTITNGAAEEGGGVNGHATRARLRSCIIRGNSADSEGAGVHDVDGDITDCVITDNHVGFGSGGGMSRCDGTISECIVSDNSARWGAGLDDCQGAILNCRVTGNSADVAGGGFAYCHGPITNCIVSANTSGNAGGGLYECNGPIHSCLVSANRAAISGGFSRCAGTIANCTVVGNRAITFSTVSSAAIANCTGDVRNSIFWNNGTPYAYRSTTPTYSIVPPGRALGTGSFSEDPLFVIPGHWDPDGYWIDGDYHLTQNSPAIEAGDPTTPVAPGDTDLDGRPRVIGDRIDLGAYEKPQG